MIAAAFRPVETPWPLLSVLQPWADFLACNDEVVARIRAMNPDLADHLPKDVENRSRRTTHRGAVAVHASGSRVDRDAMTRFGLDPRRFVRGAIVGTAVIDDVVGNSTSWWAAQGQWNWLVSGQRRLLSPITCVGYQSMRAMEPMVFGQLRRRLADDETAAR
jgi:hypothetical protein